MVSGLGSSNFIAYSKVSVYKKVICAGVMCGGIGIQYANGIAIGGRAIEFSGM